MRFLTLDRAKVLGCISLVFLTFINVYDIQFDLHTLGMPSIVFIYLKKALEVILFPLMFVISGATIRYEMETKRTGLLLKSRIRRLLYPYLLGVGVLGCMYYFFKNSAIVKDKVLSSFCYANYGIFSGMHLGIFAVLFFMILLMLPLFKLIKEKELHSEIESFTDNNVWLFTPILDLWLADMILGHVEWIGFRSAGGANVIMLLVCFVYGYIYFSNTEIVSKMKEYKNKVIFAGGVSCIMLEWVLQQTPIPHGWTNPYMAVVLLRSIAIWCPIMGIISILHRPIPKIDGIVRGMAPFTLHIYILYTLVLVLGNLLFYTLLHNQVLSFVLANIITLLLVLFFVFLHKRFLDTKSSKI